MNAQDDNLCQPTSQADIQLSRDYNKRGELKIVIVGKDL